VTLFYRCNLDDVNTKCSCAYQCTIRHTLRHTWWGLILVRLWPIEKRVSLWGGRLLRLRTGSREGVTWPACKRVEAHMLEDFCSLFACTPPQDPRYMSHDPGLGDLPGISVLKERCWVCRVCMWTRDWESETLHYITRTEEREQNVSHNSQPFFFWVYNHKFTTVVSHVRVWLEREFLCVQNSWASQHEAQRATYWACLLYSLSLLGQKERDEQASKREFFFFFTFFFFFKNIWSEFFFAKLYIYCRGDGGRDTTVGV
jgi:hypothetical protein